MIINDAIRLRFRRRETSPLPGSSHCLRIEVARIPRATQSSVKYSRKRKTRKTRRTIYRETERQTDKQTERQTGKQANR